MFRLLCLSAPHSARKRESSQVDLSFEGRAKPLNDRPVHTGGQTVVYWMQNSQRPTDNPALDQAIALANEHGVGSSSTLLWTPPRHKPPRSRSRS